VAGDKKKVGGEPLAAFHPRVKIYIRLPIPIVPNYRQQSRYFVPT